MHQIVHLSPVGCFTAARGKSMQKNREVSGVFKAFNTNTLNFQQYFKNKLSSHHSTIAYAQLQTQNK